MTVLRTVRVALVCILFFLTLLACLNYALNRAHTRQCSSVTAARAEWLGCPTTTGLGRVGEARPSPVTRPTAPATPRAEAAPRVTPSAASRSRTPITPRATPRRGATGSLILEVTCYSMGTTTASGKHVRAGMAAANAYRFGTVLLIEGVGQVVVEDRSAPGATDVDIYNPSETYCRRFGRRHLRVQVLR